MCAARMVFPGLRRLKPFVKPGLALAACLVGLVLIVGLAGNGCRQAAVSGTSINLGKTETHGNFSSATASIAPDNSTFTARRVLLMVDD
jgi:hypothetical protein